MSQENMNVLSLNLTKMKHIIFDCDGVLIDTEIVAAEVVSDWLGTQGIEISTNQFIVEHTGKMFSNILKEYMAAGELPHDLNIPGVVELLDPEVRNRMRPIAGVKELLESIALPKSVVSNSDISWVEEALDKFGWANHFQKPVYSAESVAQGKPSPLVYQLAIKTIGVDKSEVIAVEDSYTGVQAALAAGIKTIGFLGGSHILGDHAARLESLGVAALAENHDQLQTILADMLS